MNINSRRAEIIVVGDEILHGEVLEINSSFIARALGIAGFNVWRESILPDDVEILSEEIAAATRRSGIIIVSGGLGPTADDISKDAVCAALGLDTEYREEILEAIAASFRKWGREMPDEYRDQARIPQGAEAIANSVGSAVGLHLGGEGFDLYLVPGVPAEMRAMITDSVLPSCGKGSWSGRLRLRTFDLSESQVEERLARFYTRGLPRWLSVISSPSGVDVYVERDKVTDEEIDIIGTHFGSYLYERGSKKLAEVVIGLLVQRGGTLAVAESVTGGALTSEIVSVAGASRILLEGLVTYSNGAKSSRLGVPAEEIDRSGAVSPHICVAMARGALRTSGADYALSTTGIAGPDGATPEKPVGLCYAGLAAGERSYCRKLMVAGDREKVRIRTAAHSLDMLRLLLTGAADRLESWLYDGS
jgi:nicotinamide-nucleotide amidase